MPKTELKVSPIRNYRKKKKKTSTRTEAQSTTQFKHPEIYLLSVYLSKLHLRSIRHRWSKNKQQKILNHCNLLLTRKVASDRRGTGLVKSAHNMFTIRNKLSLWTRNSITNRNKDIKGCIYPRIFFFCSDTSQIPPYWNLNSNLKKHKVLPSHILPRWEVQIPLLPMHPTAVPI